jgi:hypothetical protein
MNRFLTNLSIVVLVLLIAGVAAWTVPEVRDQVRIWLHGNDKADATKRRNIEGTSGTYRQIDEEEFGRLLLQGAGRVPRPADLRTPAEYRAEVEKSAEGRVCLAFADKLDAGLLGASPEVPEKPVSPEEAGRLDAEFILRDHYRIAEVRPHPKGPDGAHRFLFVLKGAVNSKRLQVRTAKGKIEIGQRSMSNPEVIVEVRDGKIYGVMAQTHVW